ncbi:UvrD-helicase domain-containing protein [Akkermansiaceae bacterium]|nr:UvrD-helicase domain-containing protein [Akkermansiaceae bacterium]
MNILAKNLMILASAGSGKTYQLGHRVIGKIGLEGVPPERMVALTFTRKAAGEFADSVLTKLAKGTLDPEVAADLSRDLGGQIDVPAVLEQVVKALPRLQLTTLDGFFARIVRGFQYELGVSGGTFDLLQGERKKSAESEILESVLRDGFSEREDFYHAFRRATLGRGEQGVQKSLEEFIKDWHGILKKGVSPAMFGGAHVFTDLPEVGDWAAQKTALINSLRVEGQLKALDALLKNLEDHSVGRSLKLNTLGERFMEVLDQPGPIEVKNGRGTLEVSAEDWKKWRALFALAIRCELAAAVARTQAVGDLVGQIDQEYERQLRSKGLLSFDDVKHLLSEGMSSEEGLLRRELVYYRLDGRYDHWLLDEFQDTSYAEWQGLKSLITEAVSDPEGGLFVVGDRKQAIYGWRGGDVSLFDDLTKQYAGGLEVEQMSKSFRSCPAVLELVNAICGNGKTLEGLFGKGLNERWIWEDHLSAKPDVTGEAKVTTVARGECGEAMIEQMKAIGIGDKKLSCGVLVRSGKQVEDYADLLRAEGFDVIEEGQRKPCEDHAIGVALSHFVKWLADPADQFSQEVIAMSPLAAQLDEKFGDKWLARWDGVLQQVQEKGFSGFIENLVEPEWANLSGYGQRRASDLISALAEFDAGPDSSPRAARDWISDLEVSQAPGAAAVQVMTIHKSKGLGFDVVMLPGVGDSQIPDEGYFKVARGADWLLQSPAKWAREQIPKLQKARARWADEQLYESMCVFYVALTRSKRGLYLFLENEPPTRKEKEAWRSPANLVRIAAGEDFQCGDPQWTEGVEGRPETKEVTLPTLGEKIPLRPRSSPSSYKGDLASGSGTGRKIGTEVHELFEKIAWLAPCEIPDQPLSQAGKIVEDALKIPALHAVFQDQGGKLYREQQVELILDGRWMTGIVDRMHVFRENGAVTRVEVIDFKTDAVEGLELLGRYAGQMKSYRRALAQVFGVDENMVTCQLLSTHIGELISV